MATVVLDGLKGTCPRAAPCHKGAVMWHLPGACEHTWPGLGILKSRPAKASWAELAFGITQLLPLLLACLHFSSQLSFTAQFSTSILFKGNYDLTFRTDHRVGRYGMKVQAGLCLLSCRLSYYTLIGWPEMGYG